MIRILIVMETIAGINSMFPIFGGEYQDQEMKLIIQLNDHFHFDHNIILAHASSDLHRFINVNREEIIQLPQSLFVYSSIENIRLPTITSKNPFLIVVPGTSDYNTNMKVLTEVLEIQRSKLDMKMGLFFTEQETTADDLQRLFKWCWSSRIISIFASTTTGLAVNVFTYNPFGDFGEFVELNDVTDKSYDSFFMSQNSNFQQYKFTLGNNFSAMHPTIQALWVIIFRLMNASYVHHRILPAPRSELFPNGSVDINPATSIQDRPGVSTYLYPMSASTVNILLPQSQPYSEFSGMIRYVASDKILCYSLTIFVSIILVLSIVRYVEHKKILIFQSAADVVNLFMNDNGNINYRRLYRTEILIIIPVTFAGFIFVNDILSTLQSHLTQPFYQPPMRTIDDIYNSDLNIFVTDVNTLYKTRLVDYLNSVSNYDWSDRVVPTEFRPQARVFERISFLAIPGFYLPLLQAQKRLNVRGYELWLVQNPNPQLIAHVVNDAFPFTERLNDIILRVKSSGIHSHWIINEHSGVVDDMVKNYKQHLENQTSSVALDTDTDMPFFIVHGWLASVILFFIEIVWKKCTSNRVLKNWVVAIGNRCGW